MSAILKYKQILNSYYINLEWNNEFFMVFTENLLIKNIFRYHYLKISIMKREKLSIIRMC